MKENRNKVAMICKKLQKNFDEIYELSKDFASKGDGRMKFKCYRAMDKIEQAMIDIGR